MTELGNILWRLSFNKGSYLLCGDLFYATYTDHAYIPLSQNPGTIHSLITTYEEIL